MRRLDVREWGLSEKITQLVLPPSNGTPPIIRLHLRELEWWLNETNLSLLPKFLSPYLTKIVITTNTSRPGETVEPWDNELPNEVVPMIRSAINAFPSSLRTLHIALGIGPQTHLTEEVSIFILGHGEALREFGTNIVLSTQAIIHLMKVPHLSSWVTEQGPPEVTELIRHGVPDGAASLFPSLRVLMLRSEVGLEWLTLFEATKNRTPPWTVAGDCLSVLSFDHSGLPLDSSLISRILPFASLVDVQISIGCLFRSCISRLVDQDVERLAIALPKLEALSLGEWPCSANTCPTTIRSLLSFSVHCTNLRYLNVHFRTENLRADILDMLGYAYSQGLHSRPKCSLKTLVTGEMHVRLSGCDPVLISMGILMIFPSLTEFVTWSPAWDRLGVLVTGLRQMERLPALTEKFMAFLNEARESVENGVPAPSAVRPHLSLGLTGEYGWVFLFIDVTLCFFPQDEIACMVCEPLSEMFGVI